MAAARHDIEKGPPPVPGAPFTPTSPSARPASAVSGGRRTRPNSAVFSGHQGDVGPSPARKRAALRLDLPSPRRVMGKAPFDGHTPRTPAAHLLSPQAKRSGTQESNISVSPPEEGFSDSSGKMWMLYISEAEKHDKEISESLKGDMEGILVFTGLFSAALATFLVESYQQLSPDSGDQTVAILAQISQQLNGTTFAPPSSSFKPASSAVRVNAVWFLSLMLSLACALSATLMQQWSRRYQQLTQRRGTPYKRGRVRAYLFGGIQRSKLIFVVDAMTATLHAAVGLFLVGLFDFLLPINKTIAFIVLGFEILFALIYSAVTLAPNVFLDSPYSTPLSSGVWRLVQASMILWLKLCAVIRDDLGERVKLHQRRLKDGLREAIFRSAADAPSTIDENALEWTLKELDEDWEIETFVARMPGFFDSASVKDAERTMLGLLEPEADGSDSVLGFHLQNMLKSCLTDNVTLNAKTRKRRLHGCLRALWYCARAYCTAGTPGEMPSNVRVRFAEPNLLNTLWDHKDSHVKVVSRCISSLLALRLIRDVRKRAGIRASMVDPAEAASLLKLTQHPQQSGGFDRLMLAQAGPAELINVTTFTSSVLHIANTEKLSPRTLSVLSETFSTLGTQLPTFSVDIPPDLENETRTFFADQDANLRQQFRDLQGLKTLLQHLQQLSGRSPTTAEPTDIEEQLGIDAVGQLLPQHQPGLSEALQGGRRPLSQHSLPADIRDESNHTIRSGAAPEASASTHESGHAK